MFHVKPQWPRTPVAPSSAQPVFHVKHGDLRGPSMFHVKHDHAAARGSRLSLRWYHPNGTESEPGPAPGWSWWEPGERGRRGSHLVQHCESPLGLVEGARIAESQSA